MFYKQSNDRQTTRTIIWKQFRLLFIDPFAVTAASIVFLTLWRSKVLYNEIKYGETPKFSKSEGTTEIPPTKIFLKNFVDEDENPTPQKPMIKKVLFLEYWQWASFRELFLFIIDIPFFLLTLFICLAPWRYYALRIILKEVFIYYYLFIFYIHFIVYFYLYL